MKQLFLLLCLLLGVGHIFAQHNHSGFYFQDSSSTSITATEVRTNGEIVSVFSTSKNPYVSTPDSLYQNISILKSDLSTRDTVIWLPTDTSSKYFMRVTHQVMVNDTSFFLGICTSRPKPGSQTLPAPSNIFTFYLTPNNILSSAVYLFDSDTVGALPYWGTTRIDYDSNSKQFELFETRYDSINTEYDPFLIRFNRRGELLYLKIWDYTNPWTQDYVKIWDYKRLSDGRYLLVQPNVNDIYFFADTSETEIDTAYFDNPTRGLYSIIEKKNSYVLFGLSDGYSFQSLLDGKLQYLLWELDKADFSEKSRKVLKLKDTLNYDIRANFFPRPIKQFDNGDFVFVSNEFFDDKFSGNGLIFTSMYCVDSSYNLKWSYRLADTLYNDGFGLPEIKAIPNSPNEFVWFSRWGDSRLLTTSEVWFRKINLDGNNLGIQDISAEEVRIFSVYPNPAHNHCDILLPFLPDSEVEIQIVDIQGRVVLEQIHSKMDNLIRLNFDLPKGIYTISLSTKGYQVGQQLLVQ